MLEVLGFIAGIHLTITLFAACYRIIDLHFCLADYWLEIAARISLNGSIIFLVYFLTDGSFETWFAIGQVFFATFHISAFWLARLAFVLSRRFSRH